MCLFVTATIGFPDPENVGLAVPSNVLAYLVADILQNVHFMVAILYIQYGRHTHIWEGGNIDFLVPYIKTFPKMYSLANPQKIPTRA